MCEAAMHARAKQGCKACEAEIPTPNKMANCKVPKTAAG